MKIFEYIDLKKIEEIFILLFFLNVPVSTITCQTFLGDLSKYFVCAIILIEIILKPFKSFLKKQNLLLLSLILIYILNLLLHNPFNSLTLSLNSIYIFITVFFLTNIDISSDLVDLIIKCLLFSITVFVIVVFFSILVTHDFDRMNFFVLGAKFHPNYQIVPLCIQPAVLFYLVNKENYKFSLLNSFFHFVILLMNFYIILKMESRAQFYTCLFVIISMLFVFLLKNKQFIISNYEKYIKYMKSIIIFCIICATFGIYFFVFSNNRIFDFNEMIASGGSLRLQMWNEALQMSVANSNLFGLGNIYFVSNSIYSMVAHNSYITMLLDVGIVGLLLFLIYIGYYIIRINFNNICFIGFLLSFMISSFFVDTFNNFGSLVMFIVFVLGLSAYKKNEVGDIR